MRPAAFACFIGITLGFTLTGCSSAPVHYASDNTTAAKSLQKNTAEFLLGININNGSSPADFARHVDFYKGALASINQMQLNAEITSDAANKTNLDLLEHQFHELIEHDRERGIAATFAVEKLNRFNFLFKNVLIRQRSGAAAEVASN
jgi:hypothetical protein